MQAYVHCSPSHFPLLRNLSETLPDDLSLVVEIGKQECKTGDFMQHGWLEAMLGKVRLVQRAIEDNWGEIFLHLDADIQFFCKNITPIFDWYFQDDSLDILAQYDFHRGRELLSGGFLVCRANERMRKLWADVEQYMLLKKKNDQEALNFLVREQEISFRYLAKDVFWCPRKDWSWWRKLHLPATALMHHANWTIGVKNKVRQLKRGKKIASSIGTKEYHGTTYGGWMIQEGSLHKDSIVYSFGVGEDASFDLSLISRYGVTIHAFDPTPRSITYVNSLYESRISFHGYGIYDQDGEVEMFGPENPEHVSHSVVDVGGPKVRLPVRKLSTILKDLRHQHIDLLKMDIEGAEFCVIDDMLRTGLRPKTLLVEFHDYYGQEKIRETIQKLEKSGYRLFYKLHNDYGFVL